MYQISFYVPEENCEAVKEAMFAAGAGQIGNYAKCAWQILGQGQFQALPGSNPHIGTQNQISKVQEYKVEMVCAKQYLDAVITALKKAHPYEEPAYFVVKMLA